MKTKPVAKDLTLIQLFDRFGTDDKARAHLEKVLWPNGIVCPHCQCNDQAKFSNINANAAAKTRAGLRYCSSCKGQFTVTVGTVFEDSKIPLRKWLIAWYLICSSKKGISSLQLQRLLELGSYRTALFMAHRVRHALKDDSFAEKLDGTIEADETLVGGISSGKGTGGKKDGKVPVRSAVETADGVENEIPTTNAIPPNASVRNCLVKSNPSSAAFCLCSSDIVSPTAMAASHLQNGQTWQKFD
jgi:transposase-like protein